MQKKSTKLLNYWETIREAIKTVDQELYDKMPIKMQNDINHLTNLVKYWIRRYTR